MAEAQTQSVEVNVRTDIQLEFQHLRVDPDSLVTPEANKLEKQLHELVVNTADDLALINSDPNLSKGQRKYEAFELREESINKGLAVLTSMNIAAFKAQNRYENETLKLMTSAGEGRPRGESRDAMRDKLKRMKSVTEAWGLATQIIKTSDGDAALAWVELTKTPAQVAGALPPEQLRIGEQRVRAYFAPDATKRLEAVKTMYHSLESKRQALFKQFELDPDERGEHKAMAKAMTATKERKSRVR